MTKEQIIDKAEIPIQIREGKINVYVQKALSLPEGKALRISGISLREHNAIRAAAYYRKLSTRSVNTVDEGLVLYLYKRQSKEEAK